MYHTSYETYNFVKQFIDPEFKVLREILLRFKYKFSCFKLHQLLAKIQAKLLLNLADSLILPFNCISYALQLQEIYQSFSNQYSQKLEFKNITLRHLKDDIDRFLHVANEFHVRLNHIDKKK